MDRADEITGQFTAAEGTPSAQPSDAPPATDAPWPLDAPKISSVLDAPTESVAIDAAKIGPMPATGAPSSQPQPSGEAIEAGGASAQGRMPKMNLPRGALLAASIALAAALGAVAGSAVTAGLARQPAPPTPDKAMVEATNALRESMTRLQRDVIALNAKVEAAQGSTGAQFSELAERLGRAEKAQAEPAAKLARIAETLERLERRPAAPAAPAASEITGSVSAPRREAGPPPAEGWQLLDFYGGRAVVESRSGRLFEVGPGSSLPGLGRVEAIKRENGRVVVVTAKGVIAASAEPGRPPYYLPYR
jgi:hypothetical protein